MTTKETPWLLEWTICEVQLTWCADVLSTQMSNCQHVKLVNSFRSEHTYYNILSCYLSEWSQDLWSRKVTLCDTLWTSEPFHAKGMAAAWQIGRLDIGCRKADIPRPISCEQRTIRCRAKGIAGGPNATCNFEYLILTAIFCRIYGFPDTTCCIYCLHNIMHTYIIWCIVCIALATHQSSPTNKAMLPHIISISAFSFVRSHLLWGAQMLQDL